jgi:hypothetical protein
VVSQVPTAVPASPSLVAPSLPSVSPTAATTTPPTIAPSPTATLQPTASPAPSPTVVPSGPAGAFHLPKRQQLASFVFRNGQGGCLGALSTFSRTGTFFEQGGGGLRLEIGGATELGAFTTTGDFDIGGADPLAHWHGRLTSTGGQAIYQIADAKGCVEMYEVAIAFL